MANWQYTINIRETWRKYEDIDNETFDEDEELFKNMKADISKAVSDNMQPFDRRKTVGIIAKLQNAKHLSTFNKVWDELYDYCDSNKIWLNVQF